MSHRTLERVFVRMLFDPAFVDAVYTDADRALAGLDLTETERTQLAGVDRRAWAYDPLRRLRSLRTLTDEFKSSTTIALAATGRLASLDAFFSSIEFHDCIQHRGSLALAFSDYLGRLADEGRVETAQYRDVLRLETMMAVCRRELRARPEEESRDGEVEIGPASVLRRAAGHAVDRFNGNVIEAINTVERYLFEVGLMPAIALCEDAPRLEDLPQVRDDEPVFLLALPSTAGVSLMPLDEEYYHLLAAFVAGPLTLEEAARSAGDAGGVSAEDIPEMAASLVEEGVLVAVH